MVYESSPHLHSYAMHFLENLARCSPRVITDLRPISLQQVQSFLGEVAQKAAVQCEQIGKVVMDAKLIRWNVGLIHHEPSQFFHKITALADWLVAIVYNIRDNKNDVRCNSCAFLNGR